MELTIIHVLIIVLSVSIEKSLSVKPPHIILMVADDLGWNDVGFHNDLVHTPNLDKMASEGVILNQSYVQPTCSPSRHALLTGRYPFRDGIQMVFTDVHPKCVPLDLILLPQQLKRAGYVSHLVGKWHLGHCSEECTPTHRGFDTFYGFYGGQVDHFSHTRGGALDMRSGDVVVVNATGQYTLDLHNERSKEIIRTHDPDTPLFLFISYDMPHYPVQAQKKYLHLYSDIEDETRKKYLAMVSAMDESIGDITNTLKVTKLFDDAIVVFFSDNGGQPMFGGNNWPLRGAKLTLWEGGTRSATVVTGGVITTKGYTHNGLFHITDWFPTLLTAAGLTPECGGAVMDGVDQWTMIKDGGASARQEIVCNLDIYSDLAPPISGRAAIRYGKYKLTVGFAGAMDSDEPVEWVKPSEMCSDTDDGNDTACSVYKLAVTGENPSDVQQNQKTKRKIAQAHVNDRRPRLFNIEDDPTEEHDLAHILPELTSLLQHRLESYIPQVALPLMPHPLPAMARGMDGVHSTGWCTTEQLEEQRRASLAHVERAQHGQTKATCGNP